MSSVKLVKVIKTSFHKSPIPNPEKFNKSDFLLDKKIPKGSLMPCPFTSPKMLCAGPNFLSQPKNLTAFSASSCQHKNQFYWTQIIFMTGTKCLWLPQYVNTFLVWHKKFGPAQKIVKGQGNSDSWNRCDESKNIQILKINYLLFLTIFRRWWPISAPLTKVIYWRYDPCLRLRSLSQNSLCLGQPQHRPRPMKT